MRHSRNWHAVMSLVQFGGVPVVAALTGAVMGGGLEIAAACHVRVAEEGTMFRMPEGQRGIFVGGGAHCPDRRHHRAGPADRNDADRPHLSARRRGYGWASHTISRRPAVALPRRSNSPARSPRTRRTVNYLIIQSIARIAKMSAEDGLYAESLAAALSQTGADAEEGLRAFLEKRKPNFA